MGLITRTIAHAAAPMVFFFLLFGAVVLVYAFMGTVQYGSTMEEFSGIGNSIETLLYMVLGEFYDTRVSMQMQRTSSFAAPISHHRIFPHTSA